MIFKVTCLLLLSTVAASAQYYNRYAYAYPGRGYYAGGGYHERYYPSYRGGYSMPRTGYSYRGYAPARRYDWSWGGGNRAYLGGRGGGWGGEW